MRGHSVTYEEFVRLATADPAVVGLVLKGSQAHEGMPTAHSDHDLYVVLADGAPSDLTRFAGHRTPELDLVVMLLSAFRAVGMPGFERYGLARARVVLDRLDGEIAAILAAKAVLTEAESARLATTPAPTLQRTLFARVETAARAAGHGAVLDAWGEDLELMRPQ
ncbi:hypothetical protein KV205_31830 [Streptomyces sp. SKN60]|uniref:hypothetical protein n=1 Tax=Streptomyces sp. SKN60 TaxID=2855506 RepID=UPI002246FD5F|nr:hypothetical protein [Streptomyces sp. SKN60]MCX2185067.1 hypothetical protein [Streptomyces sp. SKN60]